MGAGPLLIFDKSALQSFSLDEAIMLDVFFLTNIVPVFYVEVLADLDKDDPRGHAAESVVSELADKTPVVSSSPNAFHERLVVGNLLGRPTPMTGQIVLDRAVARRAADGAVGFHVEEAPEVELLGRWQRREFNDVERMHARTWRASLAGVDFGNMIEFAKNAVPPDRKIASLADAKAFADWFVAERDPAVLMFALEFLRVPDAFKDDIRARHASQGQPPLGRFAPYAAYVLTVDLVFALGMSISRISPQKSNNMIDVSYLYYLPFCMVFVSGDKLHARLAPLFLRPDQSFAWAPELKAALRDLHEYYAPHRDEIERVGLYSFASRPPLDLENAVTRLWDKSLKRWRERDTFDPDMPPPADHTLRERMAGGGEVLGEDEWPDDAEYVVLKRTVPIRRGSWRMFPKGVEDRGGEPGPGAPGV